MFKEVLQSKLFTAAISVVLGFFVISVVKLEPPLTAVRKELKNVNQKMDEAEKSSLELEKLGDYLKNDTYMERQARLKLNYKKPDERVVYVYTQTTEARNDEETQNDLVLNKIFKSKVVMNLKQWLMFLIQK